MLARVGWDDCVLKCQNNPWKMNGQKLLLLLLLHTQNTHEYTRAHGNRLQSQSWIQISTYTFILSALRYEHTHTHIVYSAVVVVCYSSGISMPFLSVFSFSIIVRMFWGKWWRRYMYRLYIYKYLGIFGAYTNITWIGITIFPKTFNKDEETENKKLYTAKAKA